VQFSSGHRPQSSSVADYSTILGARTECPSLRLLLRWMWQRAFVLEYAREIAAITPPAAAPNEMLGLTRRAGRPDAFRCICRGECRSFSFGAVWRAGLERAILASMATYEYRVTEAADGTFPVELWSSLGDRSQLIYKTRGFPNSGVGGGLDCPGGGSIW
jgi:hypothetical protein